VGFTGEMVPGHQTSIKQLWNRLNSKYHFGFPVAFDSLLYNRLMIGAIGCPYIVLIDPNHLVRGVVSHIKEKDIDHILLNDFSTLDPIPRLKKVGSWKIPSEKIFVSEIISNWQEKPINVIIPVLASDTSRLQKLQLVGFPLEFLYRYAYTGQADWDNYGDSFYDKFLYHPILKLKDSTDFNRDKLYTYNFKLPNKITKLEMTNELKDVLYKTFGYNVAIEERMQPYWKVTVIDSFKNKLISRGGPFEYKENGKFLGFSAQNYPMSYLINQLWAHFQLHTIPGLSGLSAPGRPFVDETGLSNIDITVNAFMEDFEEVRKALLSQGIKIEEGQKMMKCIVISDAKPQDK